MPQVHRTLAILAVLALALVAVGMSSFQHAAAETGQQPEASSAGQARVSNVFVETFITQALQDIGMQAGVNILADPSVQGFVTVELKDVPFEQALRMVLAPGGFTYVKLDDSTYLVGKADRTSPIFHVLTRTERIRLNHIGAEEARRLLSEYYAPYVRFDPATNNLLITAAPDMVERIKADVRMIDQPPAQVLIEAVVTQISEEARRQLGLDWSWTQPPDRPETKFSIGFLPMEGTVQVTAQTPYSALVARLKQLVDSGQAEIRANPRLTVLDGQSANIFVGEDRYFKIVTGTELAPFTRLEAINVGVTLKITPRVSASGEITLAVEPTVTDVTGQFGDDLPVVSRRQLATVVRVRDGETLVLGGLVQETRRQVSSRVPILGELPVIRYLFSSSRNESIKSEVVVLITPRLVSPVR